MNNPITKDLFHKSAETFFHVSDKASRELGSAAVLAAATGQEEVAVPLAAAAAVAALPRAAEVVGKSTVSVVRDLRHHRWGGLYHDISRLGKNAGKFATASERAFD